MPGIPRIVPAERPNINDFQVRTLLKARGLDHHKVVLVGVRGYYRRTMGDPAKNDRRMYDDALVLVLPDRVKTFNFNTDPSSFGRLAGRLNALATLMLGVWSYKKGKHHPTKPNGYMALTQAAPVRVHRDDGKEESGMFGINIHRGGWTTTSSEGCQTVYPAQWKEFIDGAYWAMQTYAEPIMPYVLIDEAELPRA